MYIPLAFFFFCIILAVLVAIVWLLARVEHIEDQLKENELLNNIKEAKEKANGPTA